MLRTIAGNSMVPYRNQSAAMVASGSRPRCDLRHSIRLTRGHGSPTNVRPSEKTVEDHEGLLKTCLDDEIAIEGGRRGYNLLAGVASSEDIDDGNWIAANSATITNATTFTTGATNSFIHAQITNGSTTYSGRDLRVRYKIRTDSATAKIRTNLVNTGGTSHVGSYVAVGTSDVVFDGGLSATTIAGDGAHLSARIQCDENGVTVTVTDIQLEDVTGQSIQEPSEYTSVGVLSDPWHGFGVDGVKYFTHLNGNTTSSNIVTEARGSDISGTIGKSIEQAADNLALHNRDYTDAVWVATNITPLKDATGIDGVLNSCSTLTATAGNGTIFQTVTIASAERVNSFYVKRKTGTGTIEITDNGGTNYTDITSSINSSTWTRVDITRTQANPEFGFRIVTDTDEIEVDFSQLEAGAYPTSPIETGAGTATREADELSMQVDGNFTDAQGSCYVELTPKWNSADISADQYIIGIDSAGSAKLLYIDATNGKIETTDGTNTVADTTALVSGTTYKIGLSWFGTTLSLTVNGTTTSGTFAGSWSPDAIYIGNNDGASEINGLIGDLDLYPQAKTDAQMVALTS